MCGGHFVRLDASILQLLVVLYQIDLGKRNCKLSTMEIFKKPSHAQKIHPHPSVCWRVTAHLLVHRNIKSQSPWIVTDTCLLKGVEDPCQLLLLVLPPHIQILVNVFLTSTRDLVSQPARTPEKHEGSCHSWGLGDLQVFAGKPWESFVIQYTMIKLFSRTSCWATVFLKVAKYSASNSCKMCCIKCFC